MELQKLFHITCVKNVDAIFKEGIKCNNAGDIFLFENKSILDTVTGKTNKVADLIANNQVFLKKYAMIEIDFNGVNTPLIKDVCGENTSELQWYIKQDVIHPVYLELFGIYDNPFQKGLLRILRFEN